jgi:hypothetical protein
MKEQDWGLLVGGGECVKYCNMPGTGEHDEEEDKDPPK